jgi:hypothetical protein
MTASTKDDPILIMPEHSRPKDGVGSTCLCPGIHEFR